MSAYVLHMYVSTACQHRQHNYCQAEERPDGTDKRPAECKFCGAPCLCTCHRHYHPLEEGE